jgi:hypothetical protein
MEKNKLMNEREKLWIDSVHAALVGRKAIDVAIYSGNIVLKEFEEKFRSLKEKKDGTHLQES